MKTDNAAAAWDSAAKKEQQSPISNAFDKLSSSTQALVNTVEQLERRLLPVLGSVAPVPQAEELGGSTTGPSSPQVAKLASLRAQIDKQNLRLVSIFDKLEI